MQIHELNEKAEPKEQKKKRVGRGNGSGKGTYCGRGVKGQKARSGHSHRPFFAGGQMPLIRRIPKHGFNNKNFRTEYAIINVGELEQFDNEEEVTPDKLIDTGLVRPDPGQPVKILGDGELDTALLVSAHAFSTSAVEKIEEAGGETETLER